MKSCLIVDDSRVVRKVARKILEDLGFLCVEAADGSQAMQACMQNMPDVILLDWSMPVMDGLEFLSQLRATPNISLPKVVFCTVENEIGKIQVAMAAGADEYIMKPFDQDIIESKFTQVGIL